jgi:hypothetical protein
MRHAVGRGIISFYPTTTQSTPRGNERVLSFLPLLVRTHGPILDPSWEVQEVSLEDIVLAYLGQQQTAVRFRVSSLEREQRGTEVSK